MSTYRDEGVVLRTMRLGEADRIVTLATPAHGKVRAVAKGVRRTKSRFGGRLEPLSHVTMLCWKGRELDVVTQVEVIETFRAVREDLDRMTQAMAMLEVVDQLAVERHAMPELFRMLVRALGTLAATPSPLLAPAFLWKVLEVEGFGPVVDRCARCGERSGLVAFDTGEGGLVCRRCRCGQAVSEGAVVLVQRILGGDLARVLAEPGPPEADEVGRLATSALEHHLDRRLRAPRHRFDHLLA